MRKLYHIILCCYFALFVNSSNAQPVMSQHLVKPEEFQFAFTWLGDSIQGKWEPHVALLIPITIKECSDKLYMQFDTGAKHSLLYANKLKAIKHKYPAVSIFNEREAKDKVENFSFTLDTTNICKRDFSKRVENSKSSSNEDKGYEIIGTLGCDIFDGKIIAIDNKNQVITVSDSLANEDYILFSEFRYFDKNIILPAYLNHKKTLLYFDTGSSMVELIVDKEFARLLAKDNAEPLSYAINSWGKVLQTFIFESDREVHIGGLSIPIHYCKYIEGASDSQVSSMLKMGIGGMVGNKLFIGYKLILDTRKQRFSIVRE